MCWLNMSALEGPTLGRCNNANNPEWHAERSVVHWLRHNAVVREIYNTGKTIYSGLNEALHSTGNTMKELYEVVRSIPW